jgi:hypothetical protein
MIISNLFLNTGAAAFTSAIPVYVKPTTIPAFPRMAVTSLVGMNAPSMLAMGLNSSERVLMIYLY